MKHFEDPDIQRAYEYANAAHEEVEQRRKYTDEPYIVHPLAVAKLLLSLGYRKEVVMAALLHDTVEDTNVTNEDIAREFGSDVARLVSEVTDTAKPEDGNRKARMAINRAHTALASPEGKTIKAADINDNWSSILEHSRGFAYKWIPEKIEQIAVLRDEADPRILEVLDRRIERWNAKTNKV